MNLNRYGSAYVDALKRSRDVEGRTGRGAFWIFLALHVFFAVAIETIDTAFLGYDLPFVEWNVGAPVVVYLLATTPALVAAVIRRLNDTGLTRHWAWLFLVPVAGQFMWLVLMLRRPPGREVEVPVTSVVEDDPWAPRAAAHTSARPPIPDAVWREIRRGPIAQAAGTPDGGGAVDARDRPDSAAAVRGRASADANRAAPAPAPRSETAARDAARRSVAGGALRSAPPGSARSQSPAPAPGRAPADAASRAAPRAASAASTPRPPVRPPVPDPVPSPQFSFDEDLWAQAYEELQVGRRRALWLRVIAETEGDRPKARALYVAERVRELQDARAERHARRAYAERVAWLREAFLQGERLKAEDLTQLVSAVQFDLGLVRVTDRKRGRSLLHACARLNLHGEVSALLRAGADPNQPDADGRLPAELAVDPSLRHALRLAAPASAS